LHKTHRRKQGKRIATPLPAFWEVSQALQKCCAFF
jgi:hypothetical protein